MAAWRNWALRVPILKQWQERRNAEFVVGDIVIEAPGPQVSRSVRKSLRKNEYETAEAHLVRNLVHSGDTVLDLGSGLGLTSIAAAKASGSGRVVGYEADPAIAPLAEKNVRRNGVRVEIRNKAIAREKGVCEFHVRRSFTASSVFPKKRSKKILIEADSFQDAVDEIRPDVLVCDIEGVEKEVFAGANLSSVHRVVLEVHPELIGVLGVLKCVQHLADSGLSLVESLSFGQVLVFDRDGSSVIHRSVQIRPRGGWKNGGIAKRGHGIIAARACIFCAAWRSGFPMPPLTAILISYNEELDLPRALASLAGIADEIILVDSGSTDRTCEIARESWRSRLFPQTERLCRTKKFCRFLFLKRLAPLHRLRRGIEPRTARLDSRVEAAIP